MMRLRSSSRCCSRLMEPSCRCSCFSSGSATVSGIVVMVVREVLEEVGQPAQRGGNGRFILFQDFACRRQRLGGVLFKFNLGDLFVDLTLEVGAGAPNLRHELANLTRNLRQLTRPKQNQGQQHNKENLLKANIHKTASMIQQDSSAGLPKLSSEAAHNFACRHVSLRPKTRSQGALVGILRK